MFDVTFEFNTNDNHFYAACRTMAGRDQLGRFMGYQPGMGSDDEVVEYGEERFSTEDSIFAKYSSEAIHSTDIDDTEDDVDNDHINFDYWDEDYELSADEWVRMRYRADYPELWGDEVVLMHSTTQGSVERCGGIHRRLGFYSEKEFRLRSDGHGYRGRFGYTWKQTGRKQRHRNRESFRGAELQEVSLYTKEDFLDDHLQLEDEETVIILAFDSVFETLNRAYQTGEFGYYPDQHSYYNPEEDEDPEPVPYHNMSYSWMSGYDYFEDPYFVYDADEWDHCDDDLYTHSSDDVVDDYEFSEAWMAAAWNDIDEARLEEEREALIDQTPISHSGGGQGKKAVMYAKQVRLQPHNCLEAA